MTTEKLSEAISLDQKIFRVREILSGWKKANDIQSFKLLEKDNTEIRSNTGDRRTMFFDIDPASFKLLKLMMISKLELELQELQTQFENL